MVSWAFAACRVCLSVVLTFLFGLVFQGVGQGLRIGLDPAGNSRKMWKKSGRTILETKDQNIFDQMWTGLSYAEVTALRKRKLEWLRPQASGQGKHCWNDLLLLVHCFEMRHFNALVQVALVAMFRLSSILHIEQYGKSKNMACDVEFRAYPCAVPASRSSLHSLWSEQCPTLEWMLLSISGHPLKERHWSFWLCRYFCESTAAAPTDACLGREAWQMNASGIVWNMLDKSQTTLGRGVLPYYLSKMVVEVWLHTHLSTRAWNTRKRDPGSIGIRPVTDDVLT